MGGYSERAILGNSIDYQLVADRIGDIRATIASRAAHPVKIVAVTKGFGIDAVRAAIKAGVHDIGENYAQEMMKKNDLLQKSEEAGESRWHFIGNLQRNKVRKLSSSVFMWQSIDAFSLGEEIKRRSESAKLLVQVNMTGVDTQGGVSPSQAPALVERFKESGIHIQGLMAIGANADRETTLSHFQDLRKLANSLGLAECSMGMSRDWKEALSAGATWLRLGSALFGQSKK